MFDEQHLWPLALRSQESATRARLSSCDWATHKHYCRSPRDAAAAVCGIHMYETCCRLRHHASCVRGSELYGTNTTSLAYLAAGGRLGNTMSTYAAMLAVRSDISSMDKNIQNLTKLFSENNEQHLP